MATELSTNVQTTTTLDPEALEDLRSQLGGEVLTPDQSDHDGARRLWNGMIDQQPSLIVRPTGVAGVRRAILFAREHGLEISVKGGGHNVAGHATTCGGLMIDMDRMRGVWIEPARRTARVSGGARWADVDRESGAFGLATTGGAISTTGVAGLTLGGGVGWLVGKHGLACDNLLSVELVTAEGDFVTASADEHPDLFWALRGGGGNFGVVTSFEFQLHPQDLVLAGMVAHPPERARDVLEFYRAYTATAPDALTVYCSLMAEPEHGARIAGFALCWSGDLAEGEQVLQPLLDFGSPVMTMVGPMPYSAWQAANDPLFPPGRRYYWKGSLTSDLDDHILDAMAAMAADPPLPWVNATIEFYAGAMNRRAPDATAFPNRDARYQVLAVGAWDDPAQDETGRSWARDLYREIAPHADGGTFLNFVDLDRGDRQTRIQTAFGSHWDRLVLVKRRYDPKNVFHRNNNVVP